MKSTTVAAVLSCFLTLGRTQVVVNSTFSPARPPSIPLAVKSPYLSTWQQAGSDGGNGGYLAGQWPTFWAGQIVGWSGLIRVDNLTYTWMGLPSTSANSTPPVVNQTSFQYTSTRSIFNMDVAGLINMTVTFLSNVAPNDMMRQSFPISFMEVEVESMDGAPHSVQLYTDITAEWISGNRLAVAQWDYGVINNGSDTSSSSTASSASSVPASTDSTSSSSGTATAKVKRQDGVSGTDNGNDTRYGTRTDFNVPASVTHPAPTVVKQTPFVRPQAVISPIYAETTASPYASPTAAAAGGIAYHQVYRQTQLLFSETADQTDYGNWYYITDNTADLTHQSGEDMVLRAGFMANGYLTNDEDTNYRAINDSFPAFGYAIDYGDNVTTAVSQKWAIALAQEQAIQFLDSTGNVSLPSLWTQYHATDQDALSFYFTDYPTTYSMATSIDNQIASDSTAAAGANYSLLTTLALRQAFAGLEYANTTAASAVFMKEISSDGNVNTVDVIFPFHPVALYTNPSLLKMLLDPLFLQQEANLWPFRYSIHDIGSHFPNATGHADGVDEMQPLEECADMILMALGYAQRGNDPAWLSQHYPLLKQWNDYLVLDALTPGNQISTDDFAGAAPNQTNLALKGIVGIEAMAAIANLTGHDADGANYTAIAHDYVAQWVVLGTAPATGSELAHTTLNYSASTTYSLLYNLFPDTELGLNLVPQAIYSQQSDFYASLFSNTSNIYGIPLDTRHSYTKSDWELFSAAVASASTRGLFVDAIARFVGETPTNLPLGDLYDVQTGGYPVNLTFAARPVVGGFFSILALESAPAAGNATGNATRV